MCMVSAGLDTSFAGRHMCHAMMLSYDELPLTHPNKHLGCAHFMPAQQPLSSYLGLT